MITLIRYNVATTYGNEDAEAGPLEPDVNGNACTIVGRWQSLGLDLQEVFTERGLALIQPYRLSAKE